MGRRLRLWSLIGVLLLVLFAAGCGNSSSTGNTGIVAGNPAVGTSAVPPGSNGSVVNNGIVVRVIINGLSSFGSSVTQFQVQLLSPDTLTTIAQQTLQLGTNSSSLQAIFTNLSSNQFALVILAEDTNGNTVSNYVVSVTAPESVSVNGSQFNAGPLPPAPFPVPTPTPIPSPSVQVTVSPSASPGASPSGTPTASPGSSPSASPGASPASSPGASPASSPTASPTPNSSPQPTPTPNPGAQGKLYTSGNTISRFGNALAASGNLTPEATINTTATNAFAIDTVNDVIYQVNAQGQILVFNGASTFSGNVTPTPNRTITFTGGSSFDTISIDPVRNLIYLSLFSNFIVIPNASTANGNVTTLTNFTVSNAPSLLVTRFLDVPNNRLYLGGGNCAFAVLDGASSLNGTVAAPRNFSLNTTFGAGATFLDIAGRLSTSSGFQLFAAANAATATGNVTSALTLSSVGAMCYDSVHDQAYISVPAQSVVNVFNNFSTLTSPPAMPNRVLNGIGSVSVIDPNH